MSSPKSIQIQDYSYTLPEDRIAAFPLPNRDESKLLVFQNEQIQDRHFIQLPQLLPEHTLMVFNNTRVVHARLLFQRATGAQIEVFIIEPDQPADYQVAFASKQTCTWKCMVGNAKRWKDGEVLSKTIETPLGNTLIQVEKSGQTEELFRIRFSWDDHRLSFAEILHHAGSLPIPPYLNRDTEESDEERYQTIYAKEQGSVAAPTAGLHFTERVFDALDQKNITRTEVTLHVGAGTFKPVKADTLEAHTMHEETIFVMRSTILAIREALHEKHLVVAVGTTSVRTLESLYWHGVQLIQGKASAEVQVKQWDPYDTAGELPSAITALDAILQSLDKTGNDQLKGCTQILIAPGYTFRIVQALVTNFHQPENTLILLIAAFVGSSWRNIYEHALNHHYRFLSYGDSSLLFSSNAAT